MCFNGDMLDDFVARQRTQLPLPIHLAFTHRHTFHQ